MILGLDISTSCTGYCIFNEDGFKEIGYIKLSKYKTMPEKAAAIKNKLLEIKNSNNITTIAVEENLQAFRPGFSSAATLMKLAQFNGVVQWIAYEIFNLSPEPINVNRARKIVGLKINRKSEKTTKEQVAQWVLQDSDNISFPVREVTRGRNKGQCVITNESYDMADAYVIAKASYNIKKIKS